MLRSRPCLAEWQPTMAFKFEKENGHSNISISSSVSSHK